jgi:hypothetical protein
MFNNYALTPDIRWSLNGRYEKAIFNETRIPFQYTIANDTGIIDQEKNSIDGNFYQTENKVHHISLMQENIDRCMIA